MKNKMLLNLFILILIGACKSAGEPATEEDSGTEKRTSTVTDGILLYEQNCLSCHGELLTSDKTDARASDISFAISDVVRMQYLGFLTRDQIEEVAKALSSRDPRRISPEITSAAPYGQFIGATSELDLTVTTDMATTCRYDTNDLLYEEMRNTLTGSSDKLNHSTTLQLSPGASYTFYVNCKDVTYGNITRSSQYIQFSTDLDVPDTTAPEITGFLPRSELLGGTKQARFYVDTNEAATCRQTRNASFVYAQMDAMDNTGGQGHSHIATGLSNGQSYTFYIQCMDAGSNLSTKSSITLTVAQNTNGGVLYSAYCTSCHGNVNSSSKSGSSAQEIKSAIRDVRSMQGEILELLSDEQLEAISDAI